MGASKPHSREAGGSVEIYVELARRHVIEEYEQECDAAVVYAGLVDHATISVVNLLLASGSDHPGYCLAVHKRPDYT